MYTFQEAARIFSFCHSRNNSNTPSLRNLLIHCLDNPKQRRRYMCYKYSLQPWLYCRLVPQLLLIRTFYIQNGNLCQTGYWFRTFAWNQLPSAYTIPEFASMDWYTGKMGTYPRFLHGHTHKFFIG